MTTVFNKKSVDTTTQPLFLGEPLGLQRYDRFKYPIFWDLYNKQVEFFWRPEEIELKKDRSDFQTLTDNEKFIFTSNLKYQTMLDSVICRGVPTLLEHVSNPELEACLNVWGFFEQIHSTSYSYIIKNVYADPSSVFDSTLKEKEILKRAESAIEDYNKLSYGQYDDIKEQLYMTLISINILEAIRFYVSFICSFAFAKNKKMIGNADIIRLIKRDEAVHLYNTQTILNILKDEKSEGFQGVVKKCHDDAIAMFERAANEEKEWASYLFKDGSLIGLNETTLHGYIEWLVDSRLEHLGFPKIYNVKKNPIKGWSDAFMNSEAVQVAPQESEITSYKIGASKNDLDDLSFDDLSL